MRFSDSDKYSFFHFLLLKKKTGAETVTVTRINADLTGEQKNNNRMSQRKIELENKAANLIRAQNDTSK